MLNAELTASIVRILNPGRSTVGAGFLVTGDGLIATCAHVVRAAGAGPGDYITIAFHAADGERRARVEPQWWHDPNAEDAAILRLDGSLPAGVTPVALGRAEGSAGHPFRAFGYPLVGDIEGLWATGEIKGLVVRSAGVEPQDAEDDNVYTSGFFMRDVGDDAPGQMERPVG